MKIKLITGMEKLNAMINGGFEGSRLYLFCDTSDVDNSIVLQSIADQISLYNGNILNDLGVLLILQDNYIDDTETRFGTTLSNEEIKMLKGNIKLFIHHLSKSISSESITTVIDELEKGGQNVIGVIHNYITKPKHTNELSRELGAVTAELKHISNKYDIPVITSCESINSDSWRMMENADAVITVNKHVQSATKSSQHMEFELVKFRGRLSI